MTEKVELEFLHLAVAGCGRCTGTQQNLQHAITLLDPVLHAIGVTVTVQDVPINSAQQAAEMRLVSSPTIRVNGSDIAGQLTESGCKDCTPADNITAQIGCRVWLYQGHEHADAPIALIIDAILSRLYRQPQQDPPTYQGLPNNLQTFFRTSGLAS